MGIIRGILILGPLKGRGLFMISWVETCVDADLISHLRVAFSCEETPKRIFPFIGGQGFMKRCMLDPSGTYPEHLQTHPDAYPDTRPFREEFSTMKHTPKHAPETYPNPNMLFRPRYSRKRPNWDPNNRITRGYCENLVIQPQKLGSYNMVI